MIVGNPPFGSVVVNERNLFSSEWQRWVANLASTISIIQYLEVTLNPTSIAANTVARQSFTVTGLTVQDGLIVNPPSLTAGLEILNWRVTATNTIQIAFWNSTGAPIDEPAALYTILAVRK